jgi:hypothetical protein
MPPGDPAPMRRLPPLGSAGRRLATLLGAVLLVLILVFAGVTIQDHDSAVEEGWLVAEQAALGAAEHADRSLAAARLVADRIGDTMRRDGATAFRGAGHADFVATLRHAPQIDALQVLDAAGNLVASTLDPSPPPASFAASPHYAPLRAGAVSQLTPMLRGTASDIWLFSYNRAVRDRDGILLGIVQAASKRQPNPTGGVW